MDIAEALEYASTTNNGVLITLKRDGRPQSSNVTYLRDGDVLVFSATATRAKVKNAQRDPRVSMYVGATDFASYVVIDGEATVSQPPASTDDAATEALVDLYRRILGEHPDWDEYRRAMVADQRVIVTVRPSHAYGRS